MFFFRQFLAFLFFALVYAPVEGFAQTDVAPDLLNRPPVAAPTSKINVGAIPIVMTESQAVDNFAAGLLQGVMADDHVSGLGFIAVSEDHVTVTRVAGSITATTRFPAPGFVRLLDAIAIMQLVESGRLRPDQDAGTAAGETAPRGVTIAQVLTGQGDEALLDAIIAKQAGTPSADHIAKQILQPLAMAGTSFRDGRLEITLTDLSHFVIALVNGGAFQNGRVLMAATVSDMEETHFRLHPALPGWAYGIAEMRRNGWRALQAESSAGAFTARLVVIPEARLAYVVVAQGRPAAAAWRAMDNGFFDKMAPRRPSESIVTTGAAPTAAEARAIVGTYEPARDPTLSFVSFKTEDRLFVRATNDGTLLLSGAENATLIPQPGGYWGSTDGNINAVARDGRLVLSTGAYRPLRVYKRPLLYASLALLLALGVPAALYYERRRNIAREFPSELVLGFAAASVLFCFISILVWHLSGSVM